MSRCNWWFGEVASMLWRWDNKMELERTYKMDNARAWKWAPRPNPSNGYRLNTLHLFTFHLVKVMWEGCFRIVWRWKGWFRLGGFGVWVVAHEGGGSATNGGQEVSHWGIDKVERLILDFYVYFLPLGSITYKKGGGQQIRHHLTDFFSFFFFI